MSHPQSEQSEQLQQSERSQHGMHVLVRLDLGRGVVLEVTGLVRASAVPALAQVVARAQGLSPQVAVDATAAEVDGAARGSLLTLAREGDARCRPFVLDLPAPPAAAGAGAPVTARAAFAPDAGAALGA
ncbi:hypothetical protein [Cellulomonas massiliensis]|uniref:hypothetical protein n=1 Tax=Cellulomonas massiliensis TaxID=1465811 RepID=UPI0002DA6A5B|nr:hypothetical protein [Cellulomonas massiliensis]